MRKIDGKEYLFFYAALLDDQDKKEYAYEPGKKEETKGDRHVKKNK